MGIHPVQGGGGRILRTRYFAFTNWRCLLVKIRTFFDENPDCEFWLPRETRQEQKLFRSGGQKLFLDFKNLFKIAEKYHAEALCAEATSYDFSESTNWRRQWDSNYSIPGSLVNSITSAGLLFQSSEWTCSTKCGIACFSRLTINTPGTLIIERALCQRVTLAKYSFE